MSAAVVMAAAGVTALVMVSAGMPLTLICGGIGGGARSALAEAGIQLYPWASALPDAPG